MMHCTSLLHLTSAKMLKVLCHYYYVNVGEKFTLCSICASTKHNAWFNVVAKLSFSYIEFICIKSISILYIHIYNWPKFAYKSISGILFLNSFSCIMYIYCSILSPFNTNQSPHLLVPGFFCNHCLFHFQNLRGFILFWLFSCCISLYYQMSEMYSICRLSISLHNQFNVHLCCHSAIFYGWAVCVCRHVYVYNIYSLPKYHGSSK